MTRSIWKLSSWGLAMFNETARLFRINERRSRDSPVLEMIAKSQWGLEWCTWLEERDRSRPCEAVIGQSISRWVHNGTLIQRPSWNVAGWARFPQLFHEKSNAEWILQGMTGCYRDWITRRDIRYLPSTSTVRQWQVRAAASILSGHIYLKHYLHQHED